MLAAFVFAQNAVANSAPATAPAEFQAGVFKAMFNVDIKDDLAECFTPDQELSDHIDTFIKDLAAKDYKSLVELVKEDEEMIRKDGAPCLDNPNVASAYKQQRDLEKKAESDPDWKKHALASILPHRKEIEAAIPKGIEQWNSGDYYGAGVTVGEVDAILYSYWM